MDYGMTVRLPVRFADAVPRVREALAEQGFGILTEIDVRETMRAKLDVDYPDYLILGACNPPLAHRALTTEPRIGLLLPCNVVVRTEGAETVVEALNPQVMVTVAGRDELAPVAKEATERLRAALAALAG